MTDCYRPPKLPPEFADLERFSDWCLPHRGRNATPSGWRRSMQEMQAFYDAITARAEEAIAYCDKFSLDDMPEDVLNLMHLLYSMIRCRFRSSAGSSRRVPDSGATTLDCVSEPVP